MVTDLSSSSVKVSHKYEYPKYLTQSFSMLGEEDTPVGEEDSPPRLPMEGREGGMLNIATLNET